MNTLKFLFYASGVFVSYFCHGVLQEKIVKGKYTIETVNESGVKTVEVEKFTYPLSLVFAQILMGYLAAKLVVSIRPQAEDKTPKLYYASSSLTYLLAMVSSNMALQWVSYPTQVIGKSAKPIPVMILGVLLGKKSYPFKKYVFVFLIVLGVVMFMMKNTSVESKGERNIIETGELLLILSLVMDGLTSAIQERIRAKSSPAGLQFMVGLNGWSLLYLGLMVVASGELSAVLDFTRKFPYILTNLFSMGIAASVGQIFLLSLLSQFGTLAASLVTTTRKFFNVLASVIIFRHAVSLRQWAGALLVFGALFLDAYSGKAARKQ